MEIMVIVFILIVILNLVGSLFKRVSEGQSRSAPAGRPRPPRYRYFEVEAPEPAREGSSVEGSSAEWQDKGASGRAAVRRSGALNRLQWPKAPQRLKPAVSPQGCTGFLRKKTSSSPPLSSTKYSARRAAGVNTD